MANHVLRDRGLTDSDPELEQFTMNPRRVPKWVGLGHLADEIADVHRPPSIFWATSVGSSISSTTGTLFGATG